MAEKVAVLMDGGFVRKVLKNTLNRLPNASDIESAAKQMPGAAAPGSELYRIYFYDADPFSGSLKNPIDGRTIALANTPFAKHTRSLLQQLELMPDFAVRRGELVCADWRLGSAALRSVASSPRTLVAQDLVPDLKQKGVDMRIGLDIAALALKRLIGSVILVSGDSDMVPAMKFARREGLRVFLHTLGFPSARTELKIHADRVIG